MRGSLWAAFVWSSFDSSSGHEGSARERVITQRGGRDVGFCRAPSLLERAMLCFSDNTCVFLNKVLGPSHRC